MFKVTTNLKTKQLKSKADKANSLAQFILDEQVLKDSNYYVPMDTTTLRDSSLLHSRVGKGSLKWDTPYAKRLYYNPSFKFSKDKNPNASALWFEKAKSKLKTTWIEIARKAFKGGF